MRVIGRKWFALLTVDSWKGCLTGVQDKYFQNDEWGTGGIRSEEFEAVAVIEDFFFYDGIIGDQGLNFLSLFQILGIEKYRYHLRNFKFESNSLTFIKYSVINRREDS